jgi:methionyl aminopeptidase
MYSHSKVQKLLKAARKSRPSDRKESSPVIIIKTPEQIEGIRKSSILAAKTLDHIAPFVVPGVTTQEIDEKVATFMRDHGAIAATLGYKGYPKSSCISINEVVCHGIPGPQALKEGDIVNVDVTTILDGYYGDTSRMYAVGQVSDEADKIMNVTREALYLGIEEVRPGNRFGNIGYVIQRYASRHGYSVVYQFCGHGVGLEFHEEPQVNHTAPRNTGPMMAPGMTFTIEPMLNAGGPLAPH